jgi:hypothetical protein
MPNPTAKTARFRQKQRFKRVKRRVTCDLIVQGQSHSGLVTDMSANGLYVRTRQRPGVGETLQLVLHEPDCELQLQVRVARDHRMSGHNTTGTPSGLGVTIVSAPEQYFHKLAALS